MERRSGPLALRAFDRYDARQPDVQATPLKLIEARVRMFRHILDSDPVPISPDVTCLVGKNESGKTAFLQALQRLKPERSAPEISAAKQYPAWLEKKHRRSANLDEHLFVEACFKVEADDIAVLEAKFGAGILKSDVITMKRSYDGRRLFWFESDHAKAITKILSTASAAMAEHHDLPSDLKGLDALVATLTTDGGYEAATTDAKRLAETKTAMLADKPVHTAVLHALDKLTPTFFYFSDYSSLPGAVKIRELLEADRDKLDDDELTALSLLELAGADKDYLLQPDYETRKRELENVANSLTEDILDYWTTNQQIRVEIDITQKTIETQKAVQNPQAPYQQITVQSQTTVLDELKIRLRDDRHSLSLPFDERSTGFKWFFSFLAAFSAYEDSEKPLIILLDEPGLGLHARAQKDFLTEWYAFGLKRLEVARRAIPRSRSLDLSRPCLRSGSENLSALRQQAGQPY